MKAQEPNIHCIEDVLAAYAEEVLLSSCGYFVYMLRTTGEDEACIFLKDNRCMIQPVKPKACRTYPLSAEPLESGSFNFYLSTEYQHHYETGKVFKVRDWMKRYFTEEEREAARIEFKELPEIVRLLQKIPDEMKKAAFFRFLRYKYCEYDLEKPFLEQYKQNHKKLIRSLETLLNSQP